MRRAVGAGARGEKRTKEYALDWGIFCPSRRNHRALSTPQLARCPLKTSSFIVRVPAQQARAESENPALFLQSRGRDVRLWATRLRLERFLRHRDFKRKKNKTLTCALVAKQSRTSPASSGSTAALDRMADGLKKGSKGRERRKDEEDEENVAAVQRLFNLLFRNSLHPSLFLRLSLSKQSSPFSFSAPFSSLILVPRPTSATS